MIWSHLISLHILPWLEFTVTSTNQVLIRWYLNIFKLRKVLHPYYLRILWYIKLHFDIIFTQTLPPTNDSENANPTEYRLRNQQHTQASFNDAEDVLEEEQEVMMCREVINHDLEYNTCIDDNVSYKEISFEVFQSLPGNTNTRKVIMVKSMTLSAKSCWTVE